MRYHYRNSTTHAGDWSASRPKPKVFYDSSDDYRKDAGRRCRTLGRAACLDVIRRRLTDANIFFPDVWEKLQETDLPVLREIVASEFEREIFERVRPSGPL